MPFSIHNHHCNGILVIEIMIRKLLRFDFFLVISLIIGLLPAFFLIHILAKDFIGYYFLSLSFLKHHGYAYQILSNHCDNPVNSGLNARAPLVPVLMAVSMAFFKPTLLGIYLPFFIMRVLLLPVVYLAKLGQQPI